MRLHEGLGKAAARARAVELLDLMQLPAPAALAARYPHQLSGGQRQRVMIAAAIACRPRLLIADEPTTALDATVQAQILDLLHRLQQEMSMAMLLITHDLGVVARWADTVSVMFDGALIESGETAAVFATPQHAYTRGLVQASLLHACAPGTRLPEIQVARGSDGRATDFQVVRKAGSKPPAQATAPDAAPLLRVEELAVRYPGREAAAAVDGVSFTLAQGEVLGLVGESGCGKSSLSRALLRLVPASGTVELAGRDVLALRGADLRAHRRDVQMVFQDPYGSLNPRHTVAEILDAGLAIQGVARPVRTARMAKILDAVGLPAASGSRYPHEFSGGQRQRIGIARALMLEPKLVVCDEAVSALDVSVRAQILNLLMDLKQAFGLSYLFISHDLGVVRHVADRVLVMHRGRIVEQGPAQQLWQHPTHPYTRALLQAVPARLDTRLLSSPTAT